MDPLCGLGVLVVSFNAVGHFGVREIHYKVNLASDLAEAERAVEVVADIVLHESFDLGMREAGRAKVGQGVLDQLPAQAVAPILGGDCQVGNVADPHGPVLPCGNVAGDLPIVFGDEDPAWLARRVVVEVPGLAPSPIVAVDRTALALDPLIDRNSVERGNRNRLERWQVVGSVRADEHGGRESGVGGSGKRLQIAK